jgi:predicted DNA-binding transcriptional regulator YafY
MRRADRLFEIVQILRSRRLTTATYLADVLEISERTVYRDIQDLLCGGVPVRGEAGVGYVLEKSYDLPPLMFTNEEIEALTLGARLVRSWADPSLARAADRALSKIDTVLPKALKGRIENLPLFALNFAPDPDTGDRLHTLRGAVREKRKVVLGYRSAADQATKRTIRPLCLTFFAPVWMLSAWCELRNEFRNFRLDRITEICLEDTKFEDEPGKTLNDFLAQVAGE